MTGERSYTTKIWRLPSSIGFSSADALSTSMDPPGEPVISTRKRSCQKIQNGSEFPELVAQNFRNPHGDWVALPVQSFETSGLGQKPEQSTPQLHGGERRLGSERVICPQKRRRNR